MALLSDHSKSSWSTAESTTIGSPPSLTFSDFSSITTEDMMEILTSGEDVSDVMEEILARLERVVAHLRQNSEFEIANEIAKHGISIAASFNNATATWDLDRHFINRPPPARPLQSISHNGTSTTTGSSPVSSWAAVAATATGPNNRLIKFRPNDGVKIRVEAPAATTSDPDMRVVWVQGWTKDRHLGEISEKISHGPLFSMAYVENHNAVCIIFCQAEGARAFLEAEKDHIQRYKAGHFGPSCHLMQGQAFPVDKDLSLMSHPANERRRLTFARSQLFVGGLTVEKFKRDICSIVGEGNVELVWLFNTGNATVVFSGTLIARVIRDEFRKRARQNGPYRDVQVSFSHDPCERPLNLITQIPGMQDGRSRSDSRVEGSRIANGAGGQANGNHARAGRRQSTVSNRPVVDADGWQTVARRR